MEILENKQKSKKTIKVIYFFTIFLGSVLVLSFLNGEKIHKQAMIQGAEKQSEVAVTN